MKYLKSSLRLTWGSGGTPAKANSWACVCRSCCEPGADAWRGSAALHVGRLRGSPCKLGDGGAPVGNQIGAERRPKNW